MSGTRPRSRSPFPSSTEAVASRKAVDPSPLAPPAADRAVRLSVIASLGVVAFFAGLWGGYLLWAGDITAAVSSPGGQPAPAVDLDALRQQVNPSEGYPMGIRYGDLGPRLLAAGVIDFEAFSALYDHAGKPLSAEQIDVLVRGSDKEVVISPENSYFLLNFFWAVGLANANSILTEGPMVRHSEGRIDGFASTGGWSIATKPIDEIYARLDLIPLTPEQQRRLEVAAGAVYRPCCNNPTFFPDCNHGMAMLGILELMASQNASPEEMFSAAKYVNAYWFPDQALESALYLKTQRAIDFGQADARMLTGAEFASGSGAAAIHKDLQLSGLLPPETGGSGNCSN